MDPQDPASELHSDGPCFTAGMPERDNLKIFSADTVVNEIANASEVQPANYVRARCFNLGADAGFFNEQGQGRL